MHPVGPLLASGRDADIFECGPGLVLRRSRRGRSLVDEARVMTFARDQGYPVPAVEELRHDGTELVMQRLDGESMMAALLRRPWTMARHGSVLAELHQQLHGIAAPAWLGASPLSKGDRLVHLDLHPMNVMLTPTGPMVIDWTRAGRGNPPTDVALTWVLIAAGGIPAARLAAFALGQGRRPLIRSFLKHFDNRPEIVDELRAAVEWKARDPNMSPGEQAAMWRLVKTHEARQGSAVAFGASRALALADGLASLLVETTRSRRRATGPSVVVDAPLATRRRGETQGAARQPLGCALANVPPPRPHGPRGRDARAASPSGEGQAKEIPPRRNAPRPGYWSCWRADHRGPTRW